MKIFIYKPKVYIEQIFYELLYSNKYLLVIELLN